MTRWEIDSSVNLSDGGEYSRDGRADLLSSPIAATAPARPDGLALPPARMPLLQGGRPLKRWRYCGIYGEELMLCAAKRAHRRRSRRRSGPCSTARRGRLVERTAFTRGTRRDRRRARLGRGRGVDDRARARGGRRAGRGRQPRTAARTSGRASSRFARAAPWSSTRGRWELDAAGLVDASAGYHARHTVWQWSAGVGTTSDGRALCWNLVNGVHDAPSASERTRLGRRAAARDRARGRSPPTSARSASPAASARLRAGGRARARRRPRAVRERVRAAVRDVQRARCPAGSTLAQGFGVMERHDVRW